MAILKLKPFCVETLWGGTRLKTEYGIQYSGSKLAEAWMLSCHPSGPSYIENGKYAGYSLSEYIHREGVGVLGDFGMLFPQFPILIKYIDAKEDLSVQVHPPNLYALEHEGQFGKTEMWYILEADPGAFLYLGFEHEITREEFEIRIEEQTLCQVLHKQYVQKGDCYLIPPGTIHAIGKGVLLAEIQQNSNVTYRVYDYGRRGADGKMRPLHVEQAKAVTKLCPATLHFDFGKHLARCGYFTVDERNGTLSSFCGDESFTSLVFLDGHGKVVCNGDELVIQKGDSVFLPAQSGEYQIEGKCRCLCTQVGAI